VEPKQTAIVTGASRGIGKQVAIELARQGLNVAVAARTVQARRRLPGTIGETIEAIEAVGGQALAVQADMAVEADLARLVAATMERFGRVDVLINNAAATAGRSWGASLLELTREEWMAQYDVNLHAPYTLLRAVAPIMRDQGGGRVINLTTGRHDGDDPTPGLPAPLAYPSSKAALDQLCHSVAAQLRPFNISIVNVHPGFVRTEMTEILAEAGMDASKAIPMDIPSRAIVHLATCADPMSYTGTVLVAAELVSRLERDAG
jgi:NAD(P)-dependent dehydrogenase (short-subunit alcohol dehydrogenase family)